MMNNIFHNAAVVLLAAGLITGRSQYKPAAPPTPTPAPTTAPAAAPPSGAQAAADDSFCRWSVKLYGVLSAGGGEGEELIAPVPGAAAAIVNDLVGIEPAFSFDGRLLGTVDGDQVRVWRAVDGRAEYTVPGQAFVLSPDGSSIVVLNRDGWYLWDTAGRRQVARLVDSPARIFYSGDGQTIVAELAGTSGPSAAVAVYAAKTGHKLMAMENVAASTAISRDGAVLATTRWIEPDHYQAIVLWDTAAGKELRELAAEIQTRLPLAGGRGHHIVQDMAFSPDGRTLLSTGPDAVRLWNTATGEHLRCFQTLDHTGTSTIAWGPDAQSLAAPVEGGIYLWNIATDHPIALLGPAGQVAQDPASFAAAAEGAWLSWPSFSGRAGDGHKAFLWDLAAQRLATVLPVTGLLSGGALSPTGARAVTVASPDGKDAGAETLLWDTQVAAGLDLAAAQQSYWDALAATAGGQGTQDQQRLLRKAQSLSPELFGATRTIDVDEVTQYANLHGLQVQVAALAAGAEPQSADFSAEIRSRRPHWTTWSHAELLAQMRDYIRGWKSDDHAGLAAAFQVFATYDMGAVQDAGVLAALVQVLAPNAAELARQGSVARARALLQAALANYPSLDVDPEMASKAIYAQSLAWAGYNLASQAGDRAGALAKYKAAMLQYPALGIDPEVEANHGYVQWLLETGRQKAEAGDTEGAAALFKQALALDPTLDIEPQTEANAVYAQALVTEADELAMQGDTAGAEAKYTQALALDPTLEIDPVEEANSAKVQELLDHVRTAAAARDYAGAAAEFQAAVSLDPSLPDLPPDYVEALCALGPDVIGTDNAAALCQELEITVADVAIGSSVGGTLAADDVIFWRFDAPSATTITLDLAAPHNATSFGADLYGADGALLYQNGQNLDAGWHATAALPEPGRYVVAVRNWGTDGSYRLTIQSTK